MWQTSALMDARVLSGARVPSGASDLIGARELSNVWESVKPNKRPAAHGLYWFQYLMLDSILLIAVSLYALVKTVSHLRCRRLSRKCFVICWPIIDSILVLNWQPIRIQHFIKHEKWKTQDKLMVCSQYLFVSVQTVNNAMTSSTISLRLHKWRHNDVTYIRNDVLKKNKPVPYPQWDDDEVFYGISLGSREDPITWSNVTLCIDDS